jgi:DNA-binding protein YbaB
VNRDLASELAQRLSEIQVPHIDTRAIEELAEREFVRDSPDGTITATALGTGELHALDVSVLALRGEARDGVGSQVVGAVNAALDAAEEARQELMPGAADPMRAIEEMTDEFGARMDRLLASLEDLERRLPQPPD